MIFRHGISELQGMYWAHFFNKKFMLLFEGTFDTSKTSPISNIRQSMT